MNYYERHIGDYLKDTAHLSLLEHGIYGRLLDIYYSREGSLPGDQIARLVGARSDEERAALDCVLREFFVQTAEGTWAQARCEAEIARFKGKQAQAQRAAAASVASRQASSERPLSARSTPAEPALNVPSLQTQTPDTKEKGVRKRPPSFDAGAIELPAWLDRELWTDWTADRKERGKVITERAAKQQLVTLDEFRTQGIAPERVIRHAIASGNQGLYPPPKQPFNPADVARVTVPGPKPSSFLADQAEHRRLAEADRLARQARKEQAA